MRELYEKFGKRVAILVVHQREPHAGQLAFRAIEEPTNFEERRALALRVRDELQIPMTILVDGMDDASRALFGDLPSPAFVIDEQGVIRDKLPWADPELLAKSVTALLTASQATSRPQSSRAGSSSLSASPASTTPIARAQAMIERARASIGGPDATFAIRRAAGGARKAWRENPARLVAALVELAELAGDQELWREALATLEQQAPQVTRHWLEQRVGSASRPSSR